MAKPKQDDGGIPDYMVTFADLMSILVCFFVLIISFSTQDKQKLQVVAGSMKDAFGIRMDNRRAGIIELEGAPVRTELKSIAKDVQENDTDFSTKKNDLLRKQGPEANTHDIERNEIEKPRQFALAAASLRQAWKEMPEITENINQIQMEEDADGLHIRLIDQDGRAMFPRGSTRPFKNTQKLIEAMAPTLRRLPNRIKISGHTDASKIFTKPGKGLWEISAGRALSVRQILSQRGISTDRFFSIEGRADTDPLFPEDPMLAANRRITILIMSEKPNMPPEHRP